MPFSGPAIESKEMEPISTVHIRYPASGALQQGVRAAMSRDGDQFPTEIGHREGYQESQNVSYQSKALCRVWHAQKIYQGLDHVYVTKAKRTRPDLSIATMRPYKVGTRNTHTGHEFMNSKMS